jgi:hypothetical protein
VRQGRVVIGLAVAVLLAAVGIGVAVTRTPAATVPAGDVVATAKGEHFTASFTSSVRPLPINTMHTWTVWLTDAAGRPVTDALITIKGDMPSHGHGMPTAPVARSMGGGAYALEGMQFRWRATGTWSSR